MLWNLSPFNSAQQQTKAQDDLPFTAWYTVRSFSYHVASLDYNCSLLGHLTLDDVVYRLILSCRECGTGFMAEMAAIQTETNLVANVQIIHRLVTEVGKTQFDGDATWWQDRNCTCESIRHRKASTSDTIQQLCLWPRRGQRANQLPNMHKHHNYDYGHNYFQFQFNGLFLS